MQKSSPHLPTSSCNNLLYCGDIIKLTDKKVLTNERARPWKCSSLHFPMKVFERLKCHINELPRNLNFKTDIYNKWKLLPLRLLVFSVGDANSPRGEEMHFFVINGLEVQPNCHDANNTIKIKIITYFYISKRIIIKNTENIRNKV